MQVAKKASRPYSNIEIVDIIVLSRSFIDWYKTGLPVSWTGFLLVYICPVLLNNNQNQFGLFVSYPVCHFFGGWYDWSVYHEMILGIGQNNRYHHHLHPGSQARDLLCIIVSKPILIYTSPIYSIILMLTP